MAPADRRLRVQVVYCPEPGQTERVDLQLPAGAVLADALLASGLPARFGLSPEGLRAGIWSRVQEPATRLRDLDRVEIYRPLQVDPKEARRQRYRRDRRDRPGRAAKLKPLVVVDPAA
ncbi:MAG: RnfH family protein [Rubrivivax sp.]|nr:RnfH family protein [Rubrivivax sp.]MDP3613962.1 RnfH family protein [Rubrivivax sp.]